MNEEKLMNLLNSLDDDLVEKEIDKLLEGVEIDMESINKKAHDKLNSESKKIRRRKKGLYVAAACLAAVSVSSLYAKDISKAVLSFLGKTPVYDTIVNGEAYYLKDSRKLDEHFIIDSFMVSKGKLEMELVTDLPFEELGDIYIIPKDNPDIVYFPAGYSVDENNKYFLSFANKTEENYHIEPFKEFKFEIAGNTYEVSLDTAASFDSESEIYAADETDNNDLGVNMGAKFVEKDGKRMLQIITAFEDSKLQLDKLGKPKNTDVSSEYENLEKGGIRSSSTGVDTETLYVQDQSGKTYSLDIPKDAKGRPVTLFETKAPKDAELTLKVPAIVASNPAVQEQLKLAVPEEGEISIDQEIDFGIQKVKAKSIKRLSSTSASIEFELDTLSNDKVHVRSFGFYSSDIKKAEGKFDASKAVITLEFKEGTDAVNLLIDYPEFVIDGDWAINMY